MRKEGLTERGDRRFDDLLTTKGLRVVTEVTVFMATGSSPGGAERMDGVTGIGVGVSTI